MRLWFIVPVMVVLAALPATALSAEPETAKDPGVSVDLSGYYRVRYDNTFNMGWRFNDDYRDGDDNQDSDWWSYFDQRVLLLPKITVNDNIVLKTQIDALRNVTFGNNTQAVIPQVHVTRNPANTEKIETVEFDAARLYRGNIFSSSASSNAGYYAYDRNSGDEVPSVEMSRFWAEILLPNVGFMRFGRMPSQFGMGVFSNDGLPTKTEFGWQGLDKNYGDTYDRILFGTKIGPYIPVLLYDRVLEGDYKTGDNDVHEFGFVQYLRDIKLGGNPDNLLNGGLYMVHRRQMSTNARVFVYDLWLKLKLGGFSLENEAVAVQGSFTQIDDETLDEIEEAGLPIGEGGGKIEVSAYVDAARLKFETKSWGTGAEFGFSSPSDPNQDKEFDPSAAAAIAVAAAQKDADEDAPENSIDFINAVVENQAAFGKKVYTFPMDPDYDVDLIIWEVLMGGAVKNGIYAKVGGYIQPFQELRIEANVIQSWINESWKGENGEDAAHDLGTELDLDISTTAWDHFYTGVQFGYAWLGGYFQDVYGDKENIFTMQMRAGVTF